MPPPRRPARRRLRIATSGPGDLPADRITERQTRPQDPHRPRNISTRRPRQMTADPPKDGLPRPGQQSLGPAWTTLTRPCTATLPARNRKAPLLIPGFPVIPRSGKVLDLGGQLPASITSVDNAARLQQEHRRLSVGARAMLDTARHDEEVPRPEHDVAVAQLDRQLAVQTRKNSSVSACWCQVNSP